MGQERQRVNFSQSYFYEKQILGIKNAYSQESDQSCNWRGSGAGETKSQFTFAISFDLII